MKTLEPFRKRVERWMIAVLLVIIGIAVLVGIPSCAPKAIPVEPIAPKAVRVREAAEASVRASDRVAKSAETTRRNVEDTRAAAARGATEANALAKSGTATKEQLEENAKRWREAWDASLRAVAESPQLWKNI